MILPAALLLVLIINTYPVGFGQLADCLGAIRVFCQRDKFTDSEVVAVDIDVIVSGKLFAAHLAGSCQDVVPVVELTGRYHGVSVWE